MNAICHRSGCSSYAALFETNETIRLPRHAISTWPHSPHFRIYPSAFSPQSTHLFIDFGETLAIHFVDDLRHANHIPG